MWLMTQHGFYSIVQKQAGVYHVRGRVKKDLENVLELMGWSHPIDEWKGTDYQYRILINLDELLALLTRMGDAIDYRNFKNRIHELPDQKAKSAAYGTVWALMAGLHS